MFLLLSSFKINILLIVPIPNVLLKLVNLISNFTKKKGQKTKSRFYKKHTQVENNKLK